MKWIEKCLRSLENGVYPSHIIVIDNQSQDQTVSFIKNNFPDIQLIEAGKNLGFGQANNAGMKAAIENNADYVFLLNQDAWIEPDTIARLIKVHKANHEYGIISPVHLNGQGTGMDEFFRDYFLRSDIKDFINAHFLDTGRELSLIDTPFVNAAAWLISIECLRATGGFDPVFFHYGEDRNYIQRARFRGFKVGIHLSSRIYHDREQRISKAPDTKTVTKREWLHFLDQACDLQQRGYAWLICRRFFRYGLMTFVSVLTLNRKKIMYNFYMVKKIAGSVRAIGRSRRNSSRTDCIPHLGNIHTSTKSVSFQY